VRSVKFFIYMSCPLKKDGALYMKISKSFLLSFAPALFVVISGCGVRENKGSVTDTNSVSSVKVSYAQVNASVFQVSCKTCHMNGQARGGVSLDTYTDVFANLGAIKSAVFDGVPNVMPKGGLPNDQKQLLLTWIDQGAVENPTANPAPSATPGAAPSASATPTASVTPSPTPALLIPTYPSIRANIFAAKCLMCHSAGQRASDAPLDDYAAMMKAGDLVVPGNIAASGIVSAIERGSMPPKRANIPAVTPEELAIIQFWISIGAQDGVPPFLPTPSATPSIPAVPVATITK
jgi:uncharacterized membrane protein